MKKFYLLFWSALVCLSFTACLTINEKQIVPPPYVPEETESVDIEVEKSFPIYFSKDDKPVIDGEFDDWDGLEGIHVRTMVYGGTFKPENADGHFVYRTDGSYLYVFADITDDDPRTNAYEIAQAWRGDSIELFFGTDTSSHKFYKPTDVRVRIASNSEEDINDVKVSLNDILTTNPEISVAYVFTETGYKIEAAFPMSVLGGKELKVNQKVRGDFQINDADGGKERISLIHWNSHQDNTYLDASSWGNGKVVELTK
ncbi:MAG: hypothetical protein MJ188_00330 [Treponema sp.]|nr:hypothetical protein [Treponema sp.]